MLLRENVVIDSYTVVEGDTVIGAGAWLGGLSAVAAGQRIPAHETWEGAPARRSGSSTMEPAYPRPNVSLTVRWTQTLFFAVGSLAVAALFFLPVFPCFMLIDWLDVQYWNVKDDAHPLYAFLLFFMLAIPASLVLVLATALLAAALRNIFLPRQKEGMSSVHSVNYCRKWLMARRFWIVAWACCMDCTRPCLPPTWLRLMGAKVGRHAEVSTAVGIVPDLITLGDDSFIADGVMLGDEEQRGGWMILRPTKIDEITLVCGERSVRGGRLERSRRCLDRRPYTRTPDNPQMKSGQTWMGSPPMLLPARECLTGFEEALTFRPSWQRRWGRGLVESLRIVLPLAFVIATGYLIVHLVLPMAERHEWLRVVVALAFSGLLYGLSSFLLVVALKWILVGRYRPRAEPMWTPFVWLSEAVTNVYESLAVPNFLNYLRGTPMLPWALRLLGTKLGKGIYLATTDLTEFDCVTIGDEAELNAQCGPQTHLFEDRVMKIGMVEIGARRGDQMGACSTILYDTQIGEGVGRPARITLVAKGEKLPANTQWEGAPRRTRVWRLIHAAPGRARVGLLLAATARVARDPTGRAGACAPNAGSNRCATKTAIGAARSSSRVVRAATLRLAVGGNREGTAVARSAARRNAGHQRFVWFGRGMARFRAKRKDWR